MSLSFLNSGTLIVIISFCRILFQKSGTKSRGVLHFVPLRRFYSVLFIPLFCRPREKCGTLWKTAWLHNIDNIRRKDIKVLSLICQSVCAAEKKCFSCWLSISLKLNTLRSLLQNMLIGHRNWSLILSIHRRQTSRLGTFKLELFLVFKTSRIKNLLGLKWLDCFGECEEKKNLNLKISTFFTSAWPLSPFRETSQEIKKLHTHTVYWRAELSLRGCSFPECLG